MERELKITGEGKLALEPDITYIKLPITQHAYEYKQAVDSLNEKVKLVHQIIEKNGIDKSRLKTTNFNVDEIWSPYQKNKERTFEGYSASHDLTLELPINNQLISNVLSALTGNNAGIQFSIRFDVADKHKYKDQLIQKAVNDAIQSAQTIANTAGIKLKEIININYSFSEIVFHNENVLYEADLNYSEAMPDFSPQSINAEKNITIVWRIE